MNTEYMLCRTSADSKFGKYVAVALYPVVALLVCVSLIVAIADYSQHPQVSYLDMLRLAIFISAGFCVIAFLILLSICCYQMESRRITIDKIGFILYGRSSHRYTWSQVSSIGIVSFASSASGDRYQIQICIFLAPVNDSALKKLHRSYLYGAFHHKRYILLDYSQSLFKCLAVESNMEILDYQSQQRNL